MRSLVRLCRAAAAAFVMAAAASVTAHAQTITYSQSFTQGQPASNQATTAWCDFRSQLTPRSYLRAIIKGSNDPVGVSVTDPTVVAQIASALRTGSSGVWTSNGRVWRVGGCGSDNKCGPSAIELRSMPTATAGFICNCDSAASDAYVVRPNMAPTGTADLRPITSGDITVTVGGVPHTVRGLTLEAAGTPPNNCGGLNSSLSLGNVTPTAPDTINAGGDELMSDGPGAWSTIELNAPLNAGQSLDVHFLFGVQQSGSFRVFINVEVLP